MTRTRARRAPRPSAQPTDCRALIHRAITEDDWSSIFAQLAERAKEGSFPHLKLLLAYAFGRPGAAGAEPADVQQVRIVEVVRPPT